MLETAMTSALGYRDIPRSQTTPIVTHLEQPRGLLQELPEDTLVSMGSDNSPQQSYHCFTAFFGWTASVFSVIANFFMTLFCCIAPQGSVSEAQRAQESQLSNDPALGLQVLENEPVPNPPVQSLIVSTTEEAITESAKSIDASVDAMLNEIERIERRMPEFPPKEELAAALEQVSNPEQLEQILRPFLPIIFNRLDCLLKIAKLQNTVLLEMSQGVSGEVV